MTKERHSKSFEPNIKFGKQERAEQEVENGIQQFNAAMEIVRDSMGKEGERFILRPRHLLMLNAKALEGINARAGTYRNTEIEITESHHIPPDHFDVPELVANMCDYVNDNWDSKNALHLAAYLMWKINWIHPFDDGNGRTSRITSYMIMNIKLNSILPGSPSIPDQIAENKTPYYDALEFSDKALLETGAVDVSKMEELIEALLAKQLLSATEQAAS